jgi:hypothetical protein
MTRFRRLLALALLAGLGAVPAAAGSGEGPSGLRGIVTRGPLMPVCRVDVPCYGPAEVTLVFVRRGREVARTRSRADGRYRIALLPGTYLVRTTKKGVGSAIKPPRAVVPSGRYASVDFLLDTGIR